MTGGRYYTLFCLLILSCLGLARGYDTIDLSGQWGFQLDPADFERAFENSGAHRDALCDTVILPGSTDTNQKGIKTTAKPINRLSRLYEYVGPAWYQRKIDIPAAWEGKSIELYLERILWISSVYVDGTLIGEVRSFSTPHVYDLSSILTPGQHNLAICVDNRVPKAFDRWSHAFSEYTQTAWNGIAGKIELRSHDAISIDDIQIYPAADGQTARIVCFIEKDNSDRIEGSIHLTAETINSQRPHSAKPITVPFSDTEQRIRVEGELPMGPEVQLWDEFSPVLYRLTATLSAQGISNSRTATFGMRTFCSDGAHFTINQRKLFLRGTLECAVFPLTGYPDMTVTGWSRICGIAKDYGLNHIRFHSWCPPDAAFEAADRAGVYLQVELPAWTEMGIDPMLNTFFEQEMGRILAAYGNHPSFVMLCVGNELRGDFDYMAKLITQAKQADPRHLYSGSTARKHLPEDQFYVSHVTSAGGITTYGARGPQTDYDLRKAYAVLTVPGVAHEVGQRAVYPNFEEIKKYTGVLYPRNFDVFRDALAAHGMLHQAQDFFRVSGQMTALLYKESIEALLRTPNCGGFQLLDLHDFPGQGTALVGILDPFWDSKGIMTPEAFREFCGPTVPILRLPKRTYFENEPFTAIAELVHYGPHPLKELQADWDIRTAGPDSQPVASGTFETKTISVGMVEPLGTISADFKNSGKRQKLTVTLNAGKGVKNSWDIWVYPRTLPMVDESNYITASNLETQTLEALQSGKTVLLLPDLRLVEGKPGEFQNHFWTPIMFRWEPMTLGAWINHKHPIYTEFETEDYPNWQWWDILTHSKTLVLDNAPHELTPLLQVIDTYDRCLKEGVIFEARAGKGKLLMAAIDFQTHIEQRPASRQLLYSLKRYVSSPDFNPTVSVEMDFLKTLFKKPNLMTGAKVILSDSYETGNEPDKAIDDNPNTIWHTSYYSPGNFAVTNKLPETDYPHEIQIELATETEFQGFIYVPRPDGYNGWIAQYEFYVSKDGQSWGMPAAKGTFARSAGEKRVVFNLPLKAKFIRFVGLRGFGGQKWASMAELKLIPVDK